MSRHNGLPSYDAWKTRSPDDDYYRTQPPESPEEREALIEAIWEGDDGEPPPCTKTRTIGGSLLPSSEPRILQPLGKLQVRALPDLDTHGLFFDGRLIAMHPNGYSCHELAKRMAAGDEHAAITQAEYILACGGLAIKPDHIANLMKEPSNT